MRVGACGLVTALEPSLEPLAREFATSRGREFAPFDDAGGWASARRFSGAPSLTVFARHDALVHRELGELIGLSMDADLPVGLVPCTTTAALPPRTQGAALRPRSLLFSYFFGGAHVPGRDGAYGRPGWREFLDEVERGAQALVIHTHSNGADARIGDAVLCARLLSESIETPRCLPCQAGGPCIRETIPTLQQFLAASFLQCRALVLLGCTGFPPADSLLDYRTSLVHAILRAGLVESVVTSIRLSTASLPLALAAKKFLEAGGSMGELALQINRQEPAGLPHFVCVGDPEHRPLDEAPHEAPVPRAPSSTRDRQRGRQAIELLAEAELLAAAGEPDWPSIHARVARVGVLSQTPPHQPIPAPSFRLIGTHLRDPIPAAAVDADLVPCPECGGPQSRHVWRARASVGTLSVDHCPSHGITASRAGAAPDEPRRPRCTRWLFTALTLRFMADQGLAPRERALELATILERSALSDREVVPMTDQELELRIARLVADHVQAGGEAFMNRQLRYLSSQEEVDTGHRHACGEVLLGADYDPLPLRLRRRVWLCPLCGVVGESPRGHDLPMVTFDGDACTVSPLPRSIAPDGCAVALVWFPVGSRASPWSTVQWIDRPTTWPLDVLARHEFGGARYLVATLVADAEVITVRIPVLVSPGNGRTYTLSELNRA